MTALFTIHLASALFMTGLIWFVQVVHYPLFAAASPAFPGYETSHAQKTGWVVGPVMLLEMATGIALIIEDGVAPGPVAVWLNIGLLAAIWISTFALQVPEHKRLAQGYEAGAQRRLVHGNWIRTVSWTARSALLCRAAAAL